MILQLTEHKVYYVRDHLRLFTWSYECLLACLLAIQNKHSVLLRTAIYNLNETLH